MNNNTTNLINQVNKLIEDNLHSYRCTDRDSVIYYPIGDNKYKLTIEIDNTCKVIRVSYRTKLSKPWINVTFNYLIKSLERFLEQLEYINIALHRE